MTKPNDKMPLVETGKTSRVEADGELVPGQWFWIKDRDGDEWLGCVVRVGSNYALLEHPNGNEERIHFDEFLARTRRELDPKSVIEGKVAHYREKVCQLLNDVKALTASLGVAPKTEIKEVQTTALAALSGAPDPQEYKLALIAAKTETLPKLFEEIEKANKRLAMWLKAETLPLLAAAGDMKGAIKEIEGRIFNIALYAGLTEKVALVRKGEPAAMTEKLRVMQRRLYMDEESLLDYRSGGLEFKDIRAFDKWLGKPKNFARVFPFPRCMVAMQVRRDEKERDWGGDPVKLLINFELKEADKITFLYIRNGQRLYRMNCDLEFDELIFPPRQDVDFSEPLMAKMFGGRVDDSEFMKRREWQSIKDANDEAERLSAEWEKANPFKKWVKTWNVDDPNRNPKGLFATSAWERANPYRFDQWEHRRHDEYEPFDSSSVHYDDCVKKFSDRIQHWNRIALIIQGLFDRSEVLHPHPPVRSWTPEGFEAAIELVYDGSHTLYVGEPPDFEAYRQRCNESLGPGSVTVGQDDVWARAEARRENARRDGDWRNKSTHREKTFRPYGNDGPGYLARVASWQPKARKAVFEWKRQRMGRGSWRYSDDDRIAVSITVQADALFNVSAYKPGDYLQFFQDPRTRAQYMKWAPALLAAEEFHAGNLKPQEPS